jgi:toxin ParE1/3/4
MSRIIRHAAARQDLVEIVAHYIREGSPSAGRRFREQAEATFERLRDMPGLGARYELTHPVLADLRFLPISRFRKDLAFYRPTDDGIEVMRVLHGARDIHNILAEEFGIDRDVGEDDERTIH